MGRIRARPTRFDSLDSANMGESWGNTAYPTSEVLDTDTLTNSARNIDNRRDISAPMIGLIRVIPAESATASVELMTCTSKGARV